MDQKLFVSSSPHIRGENTTQKIMLDVVIALLPATIGGIYFFGLAAAKIIILSVFSAVFAEAIYQKIVKKPITINDYSAVVTGVLIALNIPASAPWWIPIVGSFFAIIIVKQLFGGIGHNFMNPALAARIMLTISWTDRMTYWVNPIPGWKNMTLDAVSAATPLGIIKQASHAAVPERIPSLFDVILGNIGGCIGETSAILLLIGGIYLVYRGVISPRVPLIYIGTVATLTFIYSGFDLNYMLYHIFSGGLMIGAIYMATDYASSPVTPKGRMYFALGCGILTTVIRLFGAYPEGVAFSILLMNVASPLINRYTSPRVFGEVK